MPITNKYLTSLIFKNIIRVIILEYNLSIPIYSENSLQQYLTDIIYKATINCNLFTHDRVHVLSSFINSRIIRGAIIPLSFQELLLEFIEILESIFGHNNNSQLPKDLFK